MHTLDSYLLMLRFGVSQMGQLRSTSSTVQRYPPFTSTMTNQSRFATRLNLHHPKKIHVLHIHHAQSLRWSHKRLGVEKT